MGFLEAGEPPLSWEECRKISEYIRQHGAIQFLNLYNRQKDRTNDSLMWGEEMEYHCVFHPTNLSPKIYLKTAESVVSALARAEEIIQGSHSWHLEYGAWMIECVPKEPYNEYLEELVKVKAKLELGRKKMRALLKEINEFLYPVSIPCFPLMGVGEYFYPKDHENSNQVSSSVYLDDQIICPHPRFPTLTRNIVARRGRPLEMYAPIFIDEYTAMADEPRPGFIHMDASGFGMGMCCVQITVNAKSIREARYLHDQLVPIGPIMLALSACTPFFKGKISNLDTRWSVLSQSMDDRTDQEKEQGIFPRYSPSALYISQCLTNKAEYNDVPVTIHEPTFEFLKENGIDEVLAKHLAYNFARDPLVVFPDKIYIDDELFTNHFENFQSTNWNSVRFKPPPTMNSNVGWRVEFRTMDIQLSDFENAAYVIFMVLMSRMIVSLGLNFQIPMSKVHSNFDKAILRDAVLNEKFWFKLNIVSNNCKNQVFGELRRGNCKDILDEMTVKEIFCGKNDYLGLLGYIDKYLLEVVQCSPERYAMIQPYLELIRKRACGDLPTGARFLREFIRNHPDYRKDSVVTPTIATEIIGFGKGDGWNEALLGTMPEVFNIR